MGSQIVKTISSKKDYNRYANFIYFDGPNDLVLSMIKSYFEDIVSPQPTEA